MDPENFSNKLINFHLSESSSGHRDLFGSLANPELVMNAGSGIKINMNNYC